MSCSSHLSWIDWYYIYIILTLIINTQHKTLANHISFPIQSLQAFHPIETPWDGKKKKEKKSKEHRGKPRKTKEMQKNWKVRFFYYMDWFFLFLHPLSSEICRKGKHIMEMGFLRFPSRFLSLAYGSLWSCGYKVESLVLVEA